MARDRLEGKHIVVTGANSGIGLEILKKLASRNNEIVAADINIDRIRSLGLENVYPLQCDISSKEGVDALIGGSAIFLEKIDTIFSNAGFPYYEAIESPDWDRIERIFATNTLSHIYTYEKFMEHLDGRKGSICFTVSAMGEMSMPGFTLYSATKYAMNGFQDAVAFERPGNITITCSYPVSTNTNFFKRASDTEIAKPFPVQTPEHVAKCMIDGVEKGRKRAYPSVLWRIAKVLFTVLPPVRWGYRRYYGRKLDEFRSRHS